MDLDTYLRDNGISGATFAAGLAISEASLSRIRRGEQNIGREMIRQIVELTGGVVTAEALVFHGASDTLELPPLSRGTSGGISTRENAA